MCHHYGSRDWTRDGAETETEEDASLTEREPVEDVTILTDGGDEGE